MAVVEKYPAGSETTQIKTHTYCKHAHSSGSKRITLIKNQTTRSTEKHTCKHTCGCVPPCQASSRAVKQNSTSVSRFTAHSDFQATLTNTPTHSWKHADSNSQDRYRLTCLPHATEEETEAECLEVGKSIGCRSDRDK